MRDEKLHAGVARSAFGSEKAKNTSCPDHVWQLRCRKSALRCGTKHISKSTCTRHTRFAALLEVEMCKKCTPSWREEHFQVKRLKAPYVRTTLGRSDRVAGARDGQGADFLRGLHFGASDLQIC